MVSPDVSAAVNPGTRQVMLMLAENGALADLIAAGFRVLESSCGPCIGMGQSPATDTVSLRTFNRNFPGRSGTRGDRVYLCSPLVAAASALTGVITDPRDLGEAPHVALPREFRVDDRMIIPPPEKSEDVVVVRGPNIKPLPRGEPLPETLQATVILKVADDITTDHIMPAGSKLLPLRSNIPAMAEHVFEQVDADFARRAKDAGSSVVVAGDNYGQGSSREHAALAPMYLGLKAVLAKSFARIHRANLVNVGILPLVFVDERDYDRIDQGDEIEIDAVRHAIQNGDSVRVHNRTQGYEFEARHGLSPQQAKIVLAGGRLSYVKSLQG